MDGGAYPWDFKELDATSQLNNNYIHIYKHTDTFVKHTDTHLSKVKVLNSVHPSSTASYLSTWLTLYLNLPSSS